MRKIITLLLAIIMLVSFVSCANTAKGNIDSYTEGEQTESIDALTSDTRASEETDSQTSAETSADTSADTQEDQPLAPAKTKVAIFTDPHNALIDTMVSTRHPSKSPGKIKRMMDKFEKMGVEYVLCLGDFIEDSGDDEENVEMLEMMLDIIRSYDIPFYTLMGNHDCAAFTKEEFYEIAQMDSAPSTVRIGDALFVYLDANFYADGSTYAPGHVEWTNTYIPQDQLDMYRAAWQNTDASEVYVFMHENIDTNIPNEKYWVSNSEQVQDVLAECPKLKGVFQGHYHKGKNSVIDGISYVTIPAVCEGEDMPYIILDV